MDTWQHWVRRLFPTGQDGEETDPPKRRTGQFLLLIAAGVLLLLLNRLDLEQPTNDVQNAGIGLPTSLIQGERGSYEAELERRLERWLGAMRNVGSVEVMITLESTERQVIAVERTEERSTTQEGSDGATGRTIRTEERVVERPLVVREDQGRTESPLVLTTTMPEIRGVVVVADGAYDPRVRYEIFQAVQTALGVPAHRVQVYPKE